MEYRFSARLVLLAIVISTVLGATTSAANDNGTSIVTEVTTMPQTTVPTDINGTTHTTDLNMTTPVSNMNSSTESPWDNMTTVTMAPTGSSVSQQTTSPSPATNPTSQKPTTTTAGSSSGFDGASFGGGIALGAVVVLLGVGLLCFCRRKSGSAALLQPSVEY